MARGACDRHPSAHRGAGATARLRPRDRLPSGPSSGGRLHTIDRTVTDASPPPADTPKTVVLPVPAAPTAGPLRSHPVSTAWIVGAILFLLAVVALGLAWRADQRVRRIEQELVQRQQDSAGQSAEARQAARQAQESVRGNEAKVALLEARVAEVALQRSQLEELMQSLSRSRD